MPPLHGMEHDAAKFGGFGLPEGMAHIRRLGPLLTPTGAGLAAKYKAVAVLMPGGGTCWLLPITEGPSDRRGQGAIHNPKQHRSLPAPAHTASMRKAEPAFQPCTRPQHKPMHELRLLPDQVTGCLPLTCVILLTQGCSTDSC